MEHIANRDWAIEQQGAIPVVFAASHGYSGESAVPGPLGSVAANRLKELAADRAAVALLAQAGFDPQGLLSFLAREQRDGDASGLPPREERTRSIQQAISLLPPRDYAPLADYNRVKDEVRADLPQLMRKPPRLTP
jgi:predicted Zn-dependent protease